MVWNDIDDELNSEGMGLINQALCLIQSAVIRFDIHVISDVISMVHLRRWVPGGDPDCIYAQGLEIWKSRANALNISLAIAIGVRE